MVNLPLSRVMGIKKLMFTPNFRKNTSQKSFDCANRSRILQHEARKCFESLYDGQIDGPTAASLAHMVDLQNILHNYGGLVWQ